MKVHTRTLYAGTSALIVLAILLPPYSVAAKSHQPAKPKPPNILFVIMDDVGIDQMRIFGYGGTSSEGIPRTPNIDTLARAGVRFRNTWAMPECSPSRALVFEGRYPFRTNIFTALTSVDLANSQVSPYEVTTPRLLASAGYENALFGKFHIAGPDNNPFGERTPRALGWDYFYGFLLGAPNPIDTTAGGVYPDNTYSCGFVTGSDPGACYFVDNACKLISATPEAPAPGFSCLEQGGIFVQNASCAATAPKSVNFCEPNRPEVDFSSFQTCSHLNGYYVSPLVVIDGDKKTHAVTARKYRTQLETDGAIEWITRRPHTGPWMATVSYSSDHSPYQQPPPRLLPPGSGSNADLQCGSTSPDQMTLSNQMVEALDSELGRLLVETGLANRMPDGRLDFHPEKTNTMLVILGDNGSFAPVVKTPFNPARSKGFTYQTGAWVPLIIAGPLVQSPDREVMAMVNVADLFELFGEIAGINVHKFVPKSHKLDSQPVLAYLTRPQTKNIRKINFTQTGNNIAPGFQLPGPCVIPLASPTGPLQKCLQQFSSQKLCTDENGVWYGEGSAANLDTCCQVGQLPEFANDRGFSIVPDFAAAIRNDRYKLVVSQVPNCSGDNANANPPVDDTKTEFYEIDEDAPKPKLDNEDHDLLLRPGGLTPLERENFNKLNASLQKLLASEPHLPTNPNYAGCPGDGNLDLVVDSVDVDNWERFAVLDETGYSQSSWYDFNYDGFTDGADLQIIEQNFGIDCRKDH
jgi:arylsulfatase A-like enzyme